MGKIVLKVVNNRKICEIIRVYFDLPLVNRDFYG